MVASSHLNFAVHWKEVIYYIELPDGTAESSRVAPPQAVAYFWSYWNNVHQLELCCHIWTGDDDNTTTFLLCIRLWCDCYDAPAQIAGRRGQHGR